ncbi:DUF1937 family protein [Thioclava litoralis]|uniref:DUF1937 family protein n=1 Tax=Thioclava litoralis TaxID=3076557 RepID=A0ABZ1DXD4_9RHOB|nr:DUF1937 family protein [Thioclava sp. FTW29]
MTSTFENWAALSRSAKPLDWSGPIVFGVGPADVVGHAGGKPVYVSSPVRLKLCQVPEAVTLFAARACAELSRVGIWAASPVILGAAMLEVDMHLKINEPVGWAKQVAGLRNAAGAIWVPACRGWASCPQIWADVQWAVSHGVPVMVEAKGVM